MLRLPTWQFDRFKERVPPVLPVALQPVLQYLQDTMDEKTTLPASKKTKGNHWLLWWKIEPEELQKQIAEYDTLKFYQSARGISLLCLLFSVAITVAWEKRRTWNV